MYHRVYRRIEKRGLLGRVCLYGCGCLALVILAFGGCANFLDMSAIMEEAAAQRSAMRGQAAPDFTLVNHAEQQVSLKDYRGKWLVLYFYPRDDTPGCTCQATEFTRLLTRFHQLDAEVIGVSPDSPASHRHFRQKYGIRLPLLYDRDHQVARMYGAWGPIGRARDSNRGRIVRGTFLINPQGVIAYHWPEVIPQGHAARVQLKLEKICLNQS